MTRNDLNKIYNIYTALTAILVVGTVFTLSNRTNSYYIQINNNYYLPDIITPLNADFGTTDDPETNIIREITAYNVGDETQTDDTPCIGAANIDLCELIEQGVSVCASNAYPLHSIINIENYGECVVLDRMAKRYSKRVDIAMEKEAKQEALNFGIKKLKVNLLNK